MSFLAPAFFTALAALGLPVYIHLLKRHKTTPTPFSSLMFFEKRTQSSVKHRRLQYLLLFSLRTLFLLLLVLAFARPALRSTSLVSASSSRNVVIAVDNSFSMREGSRFAMAKADAQKLLAGLHGSDSAQILSFAAQTHLLTDLTQDRAKPRTALDSIEPADSASSYADLTRQLRVLAQPLRGPLEVHLFSDMQKSSMPASFTDLELAPNIKLIPHAAARQTIPNFAVAGVIAPRHIYDPKRARILAAVSGFNTPAKRLNATLFLNGKSAGYREADVPANGRVQVEFSNFEAPYGLTRGEIRINSADGFPQDDHFFFSTERSDPRPALFVHDSRDPRAFLYFRTALESSNEPAFTLTAATPEQAAALAPAKYAFIVLSDLPPLTRGLESNLREYVRNGGSVLELLGRQSGGRGTVALTDLPLSGARFEVPEGGRFQNVTSLDSSHPAIRRANRWEAVKFFQTVPVEPGTARVIARLASGAPLFLEQAYGEGRVMVFTSPLDNIANDFPLSAAFVPFVEQTTHYLGGIDERSSTYTAGSYLDLRTGGEKAGAVEVIGPDGQRALSLSEAAKAQGVTLSSAGFYDVRRPNGQRELAAVNPDRKESNLEIMPEETIQLWRNTGAGAPATNSDTGGARSRTEPRTIDLWWYVLLAALSLAIAESVIGNRYLSKDKEAA
ncbi:MAG: BatA domain-containing protein [Acidobacteriota bacterium]|nr:BatA domain-containing protein [Acidobacteriota bacterium]